MAETFKKLSIVKHSNNIRESASIIQIDLDPPKDDEILVKNYFVGINATDMNVMTGRSGFFQKSQIPFELGLESLGRLETIGSKVDSKYGLQIGQIGVVFAKKPKTYAEYVYCEPSEFLPIPEPRPEYIALLDCGLTAAIGLDQLGQIRAGQTVLITAAAGGTGWSNRNSMGKIERLSSDCSLFEWRKRILS
ncbi:hypothetical protein SSS_07197 [Sarcoptes scabiei]|nr:hypothetical protein SSS_07197 [Sarcoptes scabiei]